MMRVAQLFGGAITCGIPSEFEDISSVRQVPDNQEVYVHRSGDVSIIIEILELVQTEPDPAQAVLFHWQDIVETNGATNVTTDLPPQAVPTALITENLRELLQEGNGALVSMLGSQSASKFRESAAAANRVEVYLALIRLPQFETDLLVSMNVPVQMSPESSSHEQGVTPAMNVESVFKQVLCSLTIVNKKLFG